LTLGLIGTFRARGLQVTPFKKGPDYIDPLWHSYAADWSCRCLDTFFMGTDPVRRIFQENSRKGILSLIEGNRGLFDGMDDLGTHSTAELAKSLGAPVVLVLDCTKSTRTLAALVLGCKVFDPSVTLSGVVLNRLGSARQESLVRTAIERDAGVPVLGAIPRLSGFQFLERHLGLVPPSEHPEASRVLEAVTEAIKQHVDLDRLLDIAGSAVTLAPPATEETKAEALAETVRIGVIRDAAFTFYYPENLEQLEQLGAELVFIDALSDPELPPIDALYIGGGFPETHAEQLSGNATFRRSVRSRALAGLPVYAECGGLTYLSESIKVEGTAYPMVGVFPVSFEIAPRPQGHGYTKMEVDRPNPFFPVGISFRGHEFRYSRVLDRASGQLDTAYRVCRGTGFADGRDGLVRANVLASFCHIHALGLPSWASALVGGAVQFRRSSQSESPSDGFSKGTSDSVAFSGGREKEGSQFIVCE